MRVEDAWKLQRQWSVVAASCTAALDRWRSVNLVLLLLGALLGAFAAQDEWFPKRVTVTLGAVGAAALAAAGIVQSQLLTAARVRTRVGSRAAAEALKGVVFQYLARVTPFADGDRDTTLGAKVTEVEQLAADYASLVSGVQPDAKPLPVVQGVADYVRERAEEQRDWHDRRVAAHRSLARRWRVAELLATLAAAVLAAVGGVLHGPDLSAWVAVATTAGTAFAARLAGQQHERVAEAYARTVLSLNAALRSFEADTASPPEAADFVATVEQVLAAQNESWVGLFSVRSTAA